MITNDVKDLLLLDDKLTKIKRRKLSRDFNEYEMDKYFNNSYIDPIEKKSTSQDISQYADLNTIKSIEMATKRELLIMLQDTKYSNNLNFHRAVYIIVLKKNLSLF